MQAPTTMVPETRAAGRLHALGVMSGVIYAELKEVATRLNAFSEAPAVNALSPALTTMQRAALFCGFWGVGNYLGALRELAHGIESNPPLSVERTEYVERVKTLAAGINALGLHLRDINHGVAASYSALNEHFAKVIRKARPTLLELKPAQSAPIMFMPAPPSLEVEARWTAAPGASHEALVAALGGCASEEPTAPALAEVARANPYRTLSGLFGAAVCQASALDAALADDLKGEYARLAGALQAAVPVVPPVPDSFLFSRLLFLIATTTSDAQDVRAFRKRYSLGKPRAVGGSADAVSMLDVARKFGAGMVKFRDAYLQSALSNTPAPIVKLATTVFTDAHKLESAAFSTFAAALHQHTREWAPKSELSFDDWVHGAALVLLLHESAESWGNQDAQDELAGLADLMVATGSVMPCVTMQRATKVTAIQKACGSLLAESAELKVAIEGALRSVGDDELNDSQAQRVVEAAGRRAAHLLDTIGGFCVCVGLHAAAAFAQRLSALVLAPVTWNTSEARDGLYDGLSRLTLFLGRVRPGSLIDMQIDELGPFAPEHPADEPVATLTTQEPSAPEQVTEDMVADGGAAAPQDLVESTAMEDATVTPSDDSVPVEPVVEGVDLPETAAVLQVPAVPADDAHDDDACDVEAPQHECLEVSEERSQLAEEVAGAVAVAAENNAANDEMSAAAPPAEECGLFDEPAADAALPDFSFDDDAIPTCAPARHKEKIDVDALRAMFIGAAAGGVNDLDASDAELMKVMFEESDQCVSDIERCFAMWSAPDASPRRLVGTVSDARRHIHTLKGVCRTCGLDGVGDVLHAMEDRLEIMADDGLGLAPDLAAYVDAMASVRRTLEIARGQFELGVSVPLPMDEEQPQHEVEDGDQVVDAMESAAPTTQVADDPVASKPVSDSLAAAVETRVEAESGNTTVIESGHESAIAVASPVVDLQVPAAPAVAPVVPVPAPARAGAEASVRIPLRLAARVGDASGHLLAASRRSLEMVERTSRNLREVEVNIKRMGPVLRELDILAAASIPSASSGSSQGFDPLELDRYTALQELVRRLKESFEDSLGSVQHLAEGLRAAQGAEQTRVQLSDDLQRESSELMLVGVASQRSRLERVVAKACEDAGKAGALVIEPGCRVPAAALDKLMPVFEHLLRNAVAHGVEPSEGRARAGKPGQGTITIGLPHEAVHDGSVVRVVVRDDGVGIDYDRVLAIALKRGIAVRGEQYSQEAIKEFLFIPGFSTAASVNQLSGRGVGLDVVRSAMAGLGGMVSVSSSAGGGTEFVLTLPTDTSSMSVVPVSANGYKCLLPLSLVSRIVPVSSSLGVELDAAAGKVSIGGAKYELVDLSTRVPAAVERQARPGRGHLVLMAESSVTKAVLVDTVGSQTRVIVRQLGPFVRDVPGMVAGTTMPGGEVGLVVNPLRLRDISSDVRARRPATPASKQVMVVDDSSTVRLVTTRFLRRLGFEAVAARDGLGALQMIAKGARPAGFLFDLEMPGMGGFELISEIRRKPEFADAPIIVISSRSANKHRERARQLGATAYLTKPYKDAQLQELLEGLVGIPA